MDVQLPGRSFGSCYSLIPTELFGAESCQPLNLVYNYKDKDIYAGVMITTKISSLSAGIKVLDVNSKVIFEKKSLILMRIHR
jgi:hypothetical protein